MARRVNRVTLSDEWKKKIQLAQIVNRLNKCALGDTEMTQQQIRAADILLKKVAPDLTRADVNNNHTGSVNVTANVNIV